MTPLRKACVLSASALFLCLAAASTVLAWHERGHRLAARTAIEAARQGEANGEPLPAFFLGGPSAVAHASLDPDCWDRPIGPPDLHDAESPEHRFDIEWLEGNVPPRRRYDFIALCAARRIDPRRVGFLPYAVADWTRRLTVAFAEYRRWPEDPLIQQKCLLYAGLLSHYAADLCQPLHTTIHYDGRARSDGNSPRSGIHMKVDALLGKLSADANRAPEGAKAAPMDDLFAGIVAELAASHALVDKVYDLDKSLPAYEAALDANSPAAAFAADRLRACARFTASLYLTAWKDSASIRFPEWHKREEAVEKKPDRQTN